MSREAMLRSPKNREAMAKAAENRKKAWEFRKMGATYEAIAEKLGVSHEAIRRYIQDTLDHLKADELKDATEWRRLELARLDDLLLALMPRALRGELTVVDRVLRIQERRARLLGLDAPQKWAPTNPEGDKAYDPLDELSDEELNRRAKRVLDFELKLRAHKSGTGGAEENSQG